MQSQFVVYRDHAYQWRWTFFAANGRKIADSGEGYVNKADCLAGITLLKASFSAQVYER